MARSRRTATRVNPSIASPIEYGVFQCVGSSLAGRGSRFELRIPAKSVNHKLENRMRTRESDEKNLHSHSNL